jgi:hypothetical protein
MPLVSIFIGVWHVEWRGYMHTEFWWGKCEGKRPFARPRHRWEDNVKMNLRDIG